MSAIVLDFFEYKFNHRLVIFKGRLNNYREYLEMELAEALKEDNERFINPDPTDV